jgi:hypothetical protein
MHGDDYASLDEAEVTQQISRHVFNSEFRLLRKRLDKQESLSFNIIIGAIVATFLVIFGLCYSTWLFMAEYNMAYLETSSSLEGQVEELRKENFEYREALRGDFELQKDAILTNPE